MKTHWKDFGLFWNRKNRTGSSAEEIPHPVFHGFTDGKLLAHVDARRAVINSLIPVIPGNVTVPILNWWTSPREFWPGLAGFLVGLTWPWMGMIFPYTEQCALAVLHPHAAWKNVNLVGLRAVKTPEEMQLIRRAVAISN